MRLLKVDKIEKIKSLPFDLNVELPKDIRVLGEEMIAFTKRHKGIGLSACQIGVFKQLFVYKRENKKFKIVINPDYKPIGSGKTLIYQESCLSIPKELYAVKRYKKILVTFYSLNYNGFGKEEKIILSGLEASIFQHEYDHLRGITIRMKGKKFLQ